MSPFSRHDPLAIMLKRSPHFKGKGRLLDYWLHSRRGHRVRNLAGGLQMDLDMSVPYEAMIWMEWEEEQDLKLLSRLLQPGDTLIDCGANIGLWSLSAASFVGPTGKIISIEASPTTALRLVAHCKQSPNIEVHNAALSDHPGMLRIAPGYDGNHNISRVESSGSIEVPAVTLDTLLTTAPAGVKIDVEGHELFVLRGAERVLASKPWIIIECNSEYLATDRLMDWEPHQLLHGLGYRATDINEVPVADDWCPPHGYANLLYRSD